MNKSAHVRSILFAATESAVTISQKHGSYTVLCPLIEAVLLPSLLAPCLLAAAPTAFEVASIKPTTVRDGSFTINYPPGGRFSARNITVRILLQSAYDVQDYQIQGGPAWLATAGFDIEARPAEGAGDLSPKQVQPMLRSLLADRFHLTVHHETNQHPIYALTLLSGKVLFEAPQVQRIE